MTKEQVIYNRVIDNLTYLILNYPKPVQELLSHHNVFFKGKPSKAQLINEVVQLISLGNERFSNAIEQLITRFSAQENDAFWGALAKGAIGIVGGLLGKKKRRRSSSSNSGAAQAAAQAAAAKRDMERRMAEMRAAQQRREREEQRRRQEEARRRSEEKKAAEAKVAAEKKTMYLIFGGVAVVGIGIAIAMNMKPKPPMPVYGQMSTAMPPIQAPIQR